MCVSMSVRARVVKDFSGFSCHLSLFVFGRKHRFFSTCKRLRRAGGSEKVVFTVCVRMQGCSALTMLTVACRFATFAKRSDLVTH